MAKPTKPASAATKASARASIKAAAKAPTKTPAKRLRVLSVASEMYPFVKTGGLADVVGALPAALRDWDVEVTSVIPGYRLDKTKDDLVTLAKADSDSGAVLAVNLPDFFNRKGGPYQDENGADYGDNLARFSAFSRRAAEVALGHYPDLPAFDVVHAHDWQAAAIVGHLHDLAKGKPPPTVFTIHNLAFQGRFGGFSFPEVGLPAAYFDKDWFEFYGDVNLLKAAVLRASKVTTVSETYAAEICTHEFGFGLNELLSGRGSDLLGLVNGLDTAVWNPMSDAALPLSYEASTAAQGKAAAKARLQKDHGLETNPDKPVFGLVSRLSDQKGIDLIAEQIDGLVFRGAQVVMLGSGDPALTAALEAKAAQHPTQVAFTNGYNEALAHLIHGGSDFLLVPSRFEPCGLTQLSAQRYGAVPVVSAVGGLVDTVIDINEASRRSGVGTGIIMRSVTPAGLGQALNRALALYADEAAFAQVVQNAMTAEVGWAASAGAYAALYRGLI